MNHATFTKCLDIGAATRSPLHPAVPGTVMAMRAFGASVIVSGGMGYGGVWAASGVHDIRAMASLAEMCLGVWICLGRSFLVPRIAACLGASLFLWHVISYSLGLSCGCFPGTPRGYARVVGFSFAMLGLVAGMAVWKRGVLLRLARWPSAACAVCLGCVACGWSWVSGGGCRRSATEVHA